MGECTKKDMWLLGALSVAFGVFWCTNYIHVTATACLVLGPSSFIEIMFRGVFCIVIALFLRTKEGIPSVCFIGVLVLQLCIVALHATGVSESTFFHLIGTNILYSFTMAFFLLCFARLFFTYPVKLLYCAIPVSFIIAYACGIVIGKLTPPVIADVVIGLVITGLLYFFLKTKGQLITYKENIPKTRAFSFDLKSLINPELEGQGRFDKPILLIGCIILFPLFIGIWFQVGARIQESIWLLDPLVSLCRIVALSVLLFFFSTRSEPPSFRKLSIASPFIFLTALLLSAVFWEQPLFLEIFAGIWLATFQVMLIVYCGTVAAGKTSKAVFLFGVLEGSVWLLLGIGNSIGRSFFSGAAFDQTAFLAMSFGLAFVLILFISVEQLLHARYRNRTSGSQGDARNTVPAPTAHQASSTVDEEPSDSTESFAEALDVIGERFGLSSRELAIVDSYAQGRSATHIAQQVLLAESTVRTYLKRAYIKLGVHNKQELIDLIEQEQAVAKQG